MTRFHTAQETLEPARSHASAIDMTDLIVSYGNKRVVDHLSLTVPAGTIFALVGPNGSGKTTTIKVLLGLRALSGGSARVLGYDVTRQSREVRARVGYVSEIHSLYDAMTPRQLCAFCQATSQRWNQAIVDRFLNLFGLPAKERVGRLSKGMKTQVALCLALGSDPELLILDEPTAGLDPLARHQFLNRLVGDIATEGKTIFFSSHILADVEAVADWVGIIRHGKLVLSSEVDQLRQAHQVLKLTYSEVPPAEELAALRSLNGVADVRQEGHTVRLHLHSNADTIAQDVGGRPYPLRHVERTNPTFEDIILSHLQE